FLKVTIFEIMYGNLIKEEVQSLLDFIKQFIDKKTTSDGLIDEQNITKIYCTKCGAKIKPSFSYCPYCNTKIN
ncbi:MAG: zinc-ribbon domain-containing protein, partial [Promethearchaeota archaeon]